jgi:hypothetical protein
MCKHTQTPIHTHALTPYAHIKTYNYTQHEDHFHSETDRVIEGSVDNAHVVLTIVAPGEETTKFIWGHAPELRSRIELGWAALTPETVATELRRSFSAS